LHINHFYTYIANGFQIAEKVIILITNSNLNETSVREARHRNSKENNPFTYNERVEIFEKFFENIGIPKSRYTIKPFDITDENTWKDTIDKNIPNLVNTYGDWSEAKLAKFQKNGYKVIHSSFPKIIDTSGTNIRKILISDIMLEEKKKALIDAGLMPEAIEGVLKVFNNK
jgi:nicotinamide mononucleotide adenylyltransferase